VEALAAVLARPKSGDVEIKAHGQTPQTVSADEVMA
jgi:hypothetical protein